MDYTDYTVTNPAMDMDTPTPYRYERLADLIVGMIDNGALAAGTRLPSVRAVSQQHSISISTVLQAYRLLEDRGILVARPQSGFYVAGSRRGALALPSVSRARAKASTVSISGAVAGLLEHVSNPALVPLGCAVPDAALLQSKRLDLALARAARQHGTRYNIYCAPQGDPR
ncbi:GntR family transcriptional regulator, partial [Paraburkholderia nemoris]|uniref:GntR family transcriptional regulator n=1 Tax=Paraburkholderia nemoris TaxID=2793076 RepID=UPI0038BD94E7